MKTTPPDRVTRSISSAIRQGSGSGALNPLFAASSASYSDAFLLLTAAAVVALVSTSGLKRSVGKGKDA